MTYVIDACDCDNVGGSIDTLASITYTDDGNSPATYPALPEGVLVEVVDPTETCGVPEVTLGKQRLVGRIHRASDPSIL